MWEKRCYGALSAGGSYSGLQVTEANVDEGEMEGSAAVNHLVEEFHGQRDQLDYSIVTAAYRHSRKQCFNDNFGHLDMEMMSRDTFTACTEM